MAGRLGELPAEGGEGPPAVHAETSPACHSGDHAAGGPRTVPGSATDGKVREATWMMPLRTAYSTNSLTQCSPSFRIMLLRWVSAVFTLRSRCDATSLVDLPSARSCTTSRSRGVKLGRRFFVGPPCVPW